MIIFLTVLYCISLFSLIYTTFHNEFKKYRVYTKTITSLLFVLLYLNVAKVINIYMLSAVLLCLLGDFLLALTRNGEKTHMIHGIIAFLCAHFMYISAMLSHSSFAFVQFLFPLFGLFLLKTIISKLNIELGNKKTMIYIYTCIVFFMNSQAIRLLTTHFNSFGYLLGIGGTLFMISDMILLFLYFKYKNNLTLQISNSLIYYTAQYLMAIAFMFI